jgi:hypothetical protein
MARAAPTLVVGGPEDQPIVLSGPPRRLTGQIHLHNPGDTKVVLRDAGLKDPSGALRLPEARHALQTVVLRPDQGESLPLSIAVDPSTPPGEYHAELDVGGRSRAVVLHVAEVVDLTIDPGSMIVFNKPGVAQRKRLVVTNDGNVAFTLGDPVVVDLREDPPRYRALRVAIEALLDKDRPELDDLLVALLAVAREEERLGTVEARARRPTDVQPGETTELEMELKLVDELPATRRYHGRLPVLTRDVDVVVVASTGPAQAEKPPPRRRQKKAEATKPPAKRGARR